MRPDDLVRLRHMADALRSAIRFTSGRSRADLDKDEMLAFALLRALQVVGEAAARIDDDARKQHAHIPWAAVIGMRHRLVHAYYDINHEILWTTATEAAPELLEQIEALLARWSQPPSASTPPAKSSS